MEKSFDELLEETLPLILFSFDKQAMKLLGLFRVLWRNWEENNEQEFENNYTAIIEEVKNRQYMSYRDDNYTRFVNRRKSLEERINTLEKNVKSAKTENNILRQKMTVNQKMTVKTKCQNDEVGGEEILQVN